MPTQPGISSIRLEYRKKRIVIKQGDNEKAVPFEIIDLNSMLKFFVLGNLYVWQKSQAEVTLEIDSNAKIFGSFLLLERILSNIIGNSIKYRSEEKVAILSVSYNEILDISGNFAQVNFYSS